MVSRPQARPRTGHRESPPLIVRPRAIDHSSLVPSGSQPARTVSSGSNAATPKPPVRQPLRPAASHNTDTLTTSKGRRITKYALLAFAIVNLAAGRYLSVVGWQSTHAAQTEAQQLAQQSDSPSTTKPTPSAVDNYAVAPNLPRYLNIPKLGLHARVLSVGVTATGALNTPNNVYDAAWYNESATPGQQGAVLIDGHVSSWNVKGVFYGLKTLVAGDRIRVVRGDGKAFTYQGSAITGLQRERCRHGRSD